MSLFSTSDSIIKYLLKISKAGPPLRAALTMTDRCNLRCSSCAVWKRNNQDKELSFDEIIKIIDECISLGVRIFYIFGGEPFIRKDFLDVISYISKEKKLFSETVTNGTLITKEVAERIIESKMNKIWISIDGPENIHNVLRGVEGTFQRALTGLNNLIEEKKKKNSDILVDLAVTVSKPNYKYLPKIVDIVKNMPLYEINIRHMGVFLENDIRNLNEILGEKFKLNLNNNELCFSTGKEILLNREECLELRTILKEIETLGNKYNIPIHIEPGLDTITDWTIGKKINSCLHLWTQLNINAQGKVIPCLWYDLLEIGDVRKSSIKEIWNNERYQYIRKNFSKLKSCSKCCYFYLDFRSNFKRALKVANFPFKKLIFK